MSAGILNSPLVFVPLISLACSSEKSQEIWKNLSKALEKRFERDSLLEKINVLNQDLSICRQTGTVLLLKLDIVSMRES